MNQLIKDIGYFDYAIWSYIILIRMKAPNSSGYLNSVWMYKGQAI